MANDTTTKSFLDMARERWSVRKFAPGQTGSARAGHPRIRCSDANH